MYEIYVNDKKAFCDFAVFDNNNNMVMINLLERSKMSIQAAVANIYLSSDIIFSDTKKRLRTYGSYKGFVASFPVGKTTYHQSIVHNVNIFNKNQKADERGYIDTILIQNENQSIKDALFQAVFELHDLPLLKEWKDFLFNSFKGRYLSKCSVIISDNFSYKMSEGNLTTDLKNWDFYSLKINVKDIDRVISEGLQSGEIKIGDGPQLPLRVDSIDSYFEKYGHKVIENVMTSLTPKLPRIPKIDYEMKQKKPFPVQAEVINGAVNHLKDESYIIINGGMGVGKSMISIATIAMSKENSRNVVLCPGHLVYKWRDEILDEIHDAQVTVVRKFEDVVKLKDLKGTLPEGKNFYIFSKDFAKLSYERIPIVSREWKKTVPLEKCEDCHTIRYDRHDTGPCTCGCNEFIKIRSSYEVKGAICPECGEVAFPEKAKINGEFFRTDDDSSPLYLSDFHTPSNKNSVCAHCGEKLWQPNVGNLKLSNEYSTMQEKASKWMKIKVPRNKSGRTFKTKYITKKAYQGAHDPDVGYLDSSNHSVVDMLKSRRYSPAKYIQKILGDNFFDFGIFDEVHVFKSGSSAQGNAFAQLIKATKKSIALTGTIAGGVASDIFYLLFRLEPKLMLDRGYGYNDFMKFASDYGVVEESRSFENETVYFNRTSSGKLIGSKKVKPGISPLVFTDFLINNTIFLDLSDFDMFLAKLNETPISVKMEGKQKKLYEKVRDLLVQKIKEKGSGGRKLLGSVLPTLLSLPDVNALNKIIHPVSGDLLFDFTESKEEFYGADGLLNKERKLVELVSKELEENRNVFIYAEFTSDGDKNITERLKSVLEEKLELHGQVDILKASSPQALKRMDYIKSKAAGENRKDGSGKKTRVFITNPRLVETGLDFIFKHKGKVYNFPTIIFYQIGYNMFTNFQASRRSLRLVQQKECRCFYMFYEDTLQKTAVEAIASKKAATQALQGTFSSEGLAAMANSVDPRVELANSLMNGSKSKDIEAMFAKINKSKEVVLTDEDKKLLESIMRNFSEEANDDTDSVDQLQLDFNKTAAELFNNLKLSINQETVGKGSNTVVKGQLVLF